MGGQRRVWVRFVAAFSLTAAAAFAGGGPVSAEQVVNDPAFNNGVGVVFDIAADADVADDVVLQADGKIVVAGHSMIAGDVDAFVVRLLADGRPDSSFGDGGAVFYDGGNGSNDSAASVAIDSQGRILVGGMLAGNAQVWRLTSAGEDDLAFGDDGFATVGGHGAPQVLSLPGDGVLVGSSTSTGFVNQSDVQVAKLTSAGAIDTSFGSGGYFTLDTGSVDGTSIWEDVNAIARMADGRIVVAGRRDVQSADLDTLVVRLTASGQLDAAFGGGWRVFEFGSSASGADEASSLVAVDDRLFVGVQQYNSTSNARMVVAKLDASGAREASFGSNGVATYQSPAAQPTWTQAIAVDGAGRILSAGAGWGEVSGSSLTDRTVVRFTPSGTLDTSFGGGRRATDTYGTYDAVRAMALQPDGKLVLAGIAYHSTEYTDTGQYDTDVTLERWSLAPDPPPPPTPPPPAKTGYWMVSDNGSVYAFGEAAWLGNAQVGARKAVDIEPTPSGGGYWIITDVGEVHSFGDARWFGNASGLVAGEVVTSMSRTPSGAGYWIFTSRGRVIPRGSAPFLGDMSTTRLNGPVLDSVPTPTGAGYFMVASDGGVFTFGDAAFRGSMGAFRLNAPVQSLVPDADNDGYWLVASDGGIFTFSAGFYGSMGSVRLNRPVTGMVASTTGAGYLMVAEDGGIFTFGDVVFRGSLGASPPPRAVTAVAAI